MSLRFRGVAAAAAIALTISACSSSSDDDAAGSGSGSDSSSGSAGETYTVTDTMLGDVKDVPRHPKRVVALWRVGLESVDIGVMPVGTLEQEMNADEMPAATYAKASKVPTVGNFESVDLEKLADLKPDLIIGMDNGGLGIKYDEIKEVAPTVILKIAEPTDVWDNYTRVATLLGKKTDFAARDKKVKAGLAAIKKEYATKLKGVQATYIAGSQQGGGIAVNTSKSLPYQRITGAGFTYNPKFTKNPKRYAQPISAENLPDLSNQQVIFYQAGLDGKADPATQKILDSASFKRLPAVKAGNVFPLTSGIIYTFQASDQSVNDLRKTAQAYKPAS